MLSLATPPIQVGKVRLYRDHADPDMYYYAAGEPHIAVYENRDLMYALYIYRDILEHDVFNGTSIPEEMGAGFLTVGIDCSHDEDALDEARATIAELEDKDEDRIKLAPIPYKDGTVRLIGLDIGDADQDARIPSVTDDRPKFVRNVMGTATPSLLGDLRGIFSVSLTDKGAAFMAGVHGTGALPFGVSYDLKFEGLRPAVEAKITADTSQIRTYFGGGIKGQYQFLKADISAGVEKMHRDGKVTIELTSQQTGAAAEKTKKLALDLFKERIIQNLFNPGLPSVPSQAANPGNSASAITAAANALRQTSSSASGSSGSITFSLKAEKEITTGRLEYNFSESAPEEQRDTPNAFLQALLDEDDLERTIVEIDLGQSVAFFNNLEIIVSGPSADEYQKLGIDQVTVDVFYGQDGDDTPPESKSLIFRSDSVRDQKIAFSRAGRKSVSYRYEVTYDFLDRDDIMADALRYKIPARSKAARTLSINPQEDFTFTQLRMRPGRIDEDVEAVDVRLALMPAGDEEAGATADDDIVAMEKVFRFTAPFADQPESERIWKIRRSGKETRSYLVKPDYVFANDEIYQQPAFMQSQSLLTLDDPFMARRDLLIIPNVVSENVSAIDVEIEYDDDESGYGRHFLETLRPPFAPHSISWPIIDKNNRLISYRVTVHENGLSETSETAVSEEPSITVGASLVLMDRVSVRLIGGTLADAGIDAVVVDVKTTDAQGEETTNSLFFAEGEEMLQTVPLVRRPDEAPVFSWRVQSFKVDGSQTTSEWEQRSGNPLLIISIRTL